MVSPRVVHGCTSLQDQGGRALSATPVTELSTGFSCVSTGRSPGFPQLFRAFPQVTGRLIHRQERRPVVPVTQGGRMSDTRTAVLPAVPPFDLACSVRAIEGFTPCRGDQAVEHGTVRKALLHPTDPLRAAGAEVG